MAEQTWISTEPEQFGRYQLDTGQERSAGSSGHQQQPFWTIRPAGGHQINYVTRSGTDNYGNVFYEWTGSSLDANDWFNNHTGTPRPFANNNEWETTRCGPIKKDKLYSSWTPGLYST